MKILDVSSFYSEKGGGVKTYHQAKLSYFASHQEHEYILVVGGSGSESDAVHGGRIYRIKGFPVGWNGYYRQIYDLHALRRIVRLEQPDIIESGSPYLDGWLSILARGVNGAKTVGLYHADVPDSYIAPATEKLPRIIAGPSVRLFREYTRLAYGFLDATLVTSRHIEEKLKDLGLGNVFRVPLGVDTKRFSPDKRSGWIRRELGASPNDRILLFAGRFRKEKGIDVLMRAIQALDGRPGLRMVLVGGGPDNDEMHRLLDGCRTTTALGYVDDSEKMAAIYASSDLFLAPGPHETFGLATLEAMSAGLPVVGADAGGTRELVAESGAGGLFRAHDLQDFLRSIEEALATDLDAQRERVRSFVVDNYSWFATFDRMVDFYKGLISEDAAAA